MRRRNILKDDEAVSPVIATILMVAITVVLAATLYMMLPGADDTGTPVAGSLSYRSGRSSPSDGEASFDITLQTPSSAEEDNIQITVLDDGGGDVDSGDYDVTWSVKDDDEIVSGSRLKITVTGEDIDGYEVILRVDGYSGTISDTVG